MQLHKSRQKPDLPFQSGAGTACNAAFSEPDCSLQQCSTRYTVDREVQLVNGFQLQHCALSKTTVLTVACIKCALVAAEMLGVGIESIVQTRMTRYRQFGHCNRAGQELDQSFRS